MPHGLVTTAILVRMGFNPERQHRRSGWDYVFVAAAIVVAAAALTWALIG